MAQKRIDGKMHSLTRFEAPAPLRGMRILSIEAEDRSDDHFVFLKSQQRVRRVRTTRKDSFLGTDFSIEDMEKRVPGDFKLRLLEDEVLEGESVYRIEAIPVYESGYAHLEYLVAKSDFTNLGIRYFKKEMDEPFKELRVLRESIKKYDDVLIGTHAYVRDYRKNSETHVYLDRIVLDPELENSLFSSSSLDSNRKIPGI
jgi:hypothetical protein